LDNGTAMVRFSLNKQEFFVPAVHILKALCDTTDRQIYENIVQGNTQNSFVTDRSVLCRFVALLIV
jgi:DNA-directed RNA polymerase I subunit RPA2